MPPSLLIRLGTRTCSRLPPAALYAPVQLWRRLSAAPPRGRSVLLGAPVLLRVLPQPRGARRRHHRELARLPCPVQRLHPLGRASGGHLGARVGGPGGALRERERRGGPALALPLLTMP